GLMDSSAEIKLPRSCQDIATSEQSHGRNICCSRIKSLPSRNSARGHAIRPYRPSTDALLSTAGPLDDISKIACGVLRVASNPIRVGCDIAFGVRMVIIGEIRFVEVLKRGG